MRAEPAFVDDSLSVLETLKIRHLYMDTTFCAQQFDNFITKVHTQVIPNMVCLIHVIGL